MNPHKKNETRAFALVEAVLKLEGKEPTLQARWELIAEALEHYLDDVYGKTYLDMVEDAKPRSPCLDEDMRRFIGLLEVKLDDGTSEHGATSARDDEEHQCEQIICFPVGTVVEIVEDDDGIEAKTSTCSRIVGYRVAEKMAWDVVSPRCLRCGEATVNGEDVWLGAPRDYDLPGNSRRVVCGRCRDAYFGPTQGEATSE